MAKQDQVNIKSWESLLHNKPVAHSVDYAEEPFDVMIRHTITYEEVLSIIAYVTTVIFGADDGEYNPELKEMLIRSYVLETYANFKMPKSIEKRYLLTYGTDMYEFVEARINTAQLDSIRYAIDEIIDYRKNVMAAGVTREINKIVDTLNAVNQESLSMFDGMSPEEVSALVKNLSSITTSIDEEKLVKAVISAQNGKE